VLLIAAKYFYNVQSNKFKWTENDRQMLIGQCITDCGGYAVRFPKITEEYCTCAMDSIMKHYNKADYYRIENLSKEERSKYFMKVILNCYNDYQNGIFERSEMPD
jgi:hypothetical protein